MCYSAPRRHMGPFPTCLCVLLNSQFPRRSDCARQYVLARRRQANMGVSHLSPAARNRQENLRRLLHKRRLLLQRKHQISVAPCLRGQRSKFPASHTKSRQSCVRVLFYALQGQCNPPKICCGHRATPIRQGVSDHHRMACVYCPGADHGQLFHNLVREGLPTIRSESVEREVQRQEFGSLYAAASNG